MEKQGKEQTTVRLTLRISGGLNEWIRKKAKEENMSINQFVLKILNHWRKSRH